MDPDGNYESLHSTGSCGMKGDRLGEDPVEVISKMFEEEEEEEKYGEREDEAKHAHDYDRASAPPLEETPSPGTHNSSPHLDMKNLSPPDEPVQNSVALTIGPADELPVALPIVTSATVRVDASLSGNEHSLERPPVDKGPENGQKSWSTRRIVLACLAFVVVGGLAAGISILLKPVEDPVMTLHTFYPDCHVPSPILVGNGKCDGLPYNTAVCGWDGGDCLVTKDAGKKSDDDSLSNTSNVEVNGVDEEAEKKEEGDQGLRAEKVDENGGEDNIEAKDADDEISPPNLPENEPKEPTDTLTSNYPECAGKVNDVSKVGDGTCDGFRYNIEECRWDGGDCLIAGYPDCHVDHPGKIGNGECNAFRYNTEQCGWDGGDCLEFNRQYPNCDVDYPRRVGDGQCHPRYNTDVCGWDGCDCIMAEYPECKVSDISKIGDGRCERGQYDTAECGWDGGDCLKVDWPNCHVDDLMSLQGLGNGVCNGSLDIIECGFDLGDCKAYLDLAELKDHVKKYPDCYFDDIDLSWIGDGDCDEDQYDTAECKWDGGDCLVAGYPNCHGVYPEYVGDGDCDKESNKASCGWDGGDCLQFNQKYPNCDVEAPYYVGDGECDGDNYDTAECGWDGGDCEIDETVEPTPTEEPDEPDGKGPFGCCTTKNNYCCKCCKNECAKKYDHVEPREARIEAKDDCKREECRSYYGRDPCNDSMWE